MDARLPATVRETAARLESAGHACWLVGESLVQVLLGSGPSAFELATTAPVEASLALFPSAVPTWPERGIVTLPAGAVPIDLASLRWGDRVEDDLAHRDFSVLAMAWSPIDQVLVDPASGREDLAAGRLRCVGDPSERLHEDPVRVLRAGRVTAEWGLEPDAALENALAGVAPALASVPAVRQRRELCRLLLADGADRGLALLRRTGVERRLVRDVRPDAAGLVAATPPVLELRLAAWLRGARSRALLKHLRFGLARSQHVEQLLEYHPLDERVSAGRDRSVLKLARQLAPSEIEALFSMRAWELSHSETESGQPDDDDSEARKRLAALRNALERVQRNQERSAQRTRLQIDGETVMDLLDCEPGRQVGAALRFAAEWVADDPARNDPERLRSAILAWSRENDPNGSLR